MSSATRPGLAGQSGPVLPQPTRGVGHWSWVKGSTMMCRWAFVVRPSSERGKVALVLSPIRGSTGFAPQPREGAGWPQPRRCTIEKRVRVRHPNSPIGTGAKQPSLGQSINYQSIVPPARPHVEKTMRLCEKPRQHFAVNGPGPVALGPGSRNLGVGCTARSRPPIGSPGRCKRISRDPAGRTASTEPPATGRRATPGPSV